jgi:hypothetical protein
MLADRRVWCQVESGRQCGSRLAEAASWGVSLFPTTVSTFVEPLGGGGWSPLGSEAAQFRTTPRKCRGIVLDDLEQRVKALEAAQPSGEVGS